MEGSTQERRGYTANFMLPQGDVGVNVGGTITANSTQPTIDDYEAIFGPAARQIKFDTQRNKRHQRWHLPDVLRGSNTFLADRVDGLITDATSSPFTRNILPYVYLDNPDQKLKWNVWRFDEGLATRVPYESAARVLTQSKTSQAAYITRQGMAIQMEHNFMMSPAGRENFKRQLMQLVGSIQQTNDLDVHHALLLAPSYESHLREKYYTTEKTTLQLIRQYVDSYGIMQKHPNALDIVIEDAKNTLKTWGSQPPTFLMCNGALTMQMTFNPEKTQYLTNGAGGPLLLKQGPDLPSYRGLSIVHSRKFSMNTGEPPRDILRRRSRVAEHYRVNGHVRDLRNRSYRFYDQSKDSTFDLSFRELLEHSWVRGQVLENVERGVNMPPAGGPGGAGAVPAGGGAPPPAPPRRNYQNPDFTLFSQPFRLAGPAATLADLRADAQAGTEGEGYERLRAEMDLNVYDLNHQRLRGAPDAALQATCGVAAIAPGNALALDNVSTMMAGNAGLVHWTAHRFRQARATLKAPPEQLDTLAREAALLRVKALALRGDTLHVSYATVPRGEIEAAVAEAGKRPWTPLEMSAAIGILSSVLFNSIRAPNALNPELPADVGTSFHAFLQACFARCMYGAPVCDALLRSVSVPLDLQRECLRFLGLADLGSEADLEAHGASPDSPYSTVLMLKYAAHAHPSADVRRRCEALLGLAAPELSRQLDETALDFTNRVVDGLEGRATYDFDVPALTAALQESARARLTEPLPAGARPLYTLATSTMRLNARGETLATSPVFRHARDDATRAQLEANGVKLEADAVLGTEFRCYPLPVPSASCRADFGSVDSVLEHSSLGEYAARPVQTAALRAATDDFFNNAMDSRADVLAGFYRMAFARMFTSVMHYANDAHAPPAVLAARNPLGTARHTTAARAVASPLVPALGLHFDPGQGIAAGIATFGDFYRALTEDVVTNAAATAQAIDVMQQGVFRIPPPPAPGAGPPPAPGAAPARAAPPRFPAAAPAAGAPNPLLDYYVDIVCVRPNIEHNMLAAIIGRGGTTELGATYWGQTEMTCYDDGQHGIWGMQYKYHAKALIHNERNLIRLWDICFDGYNGGLDDTVLDWNSDQDLDRFRQDTSSIDKPYEGKSMFVMSFFVAPNHPDLTKIKQPWPNPIVFYDPHSTQTEERLPIDPDNLYNTVKPEMRVFTKEWYRDKYLNYLHLLPNFNQLHSLRKVAGQQTVQNETNVCALSFHGDMMTVTTEGGAMLSRTQGSGHLGPSHQGVASVREGKGWLPNKEPSLARLI